MDWCEQCPLRLFNKKHHNLQGIGNPWATNVILIPNVDYGAYKKGNLNFSEQAAIISSLLSTGVLQTNLYIVPLIRCNEDIACEVNDDIIANCLHYFADELKLYNWKNILVCGSAWNRMFNRHLKDDFGKAIYSIKNGRLYVPNYSPLVKLTDTKKFELFKEYLYKWYNTAINKTIDYELLYL